MKLDDGSGREQRAIMPGNQHAKVSPDPLARMDSLLDVTVGANLQAASLLSLGVD
jgi:hypothetical protein